MELAVTYALFLLPKPGTVNWKQQDLLHGNKPSANFILFCTYRTVCQQNKEMQAKH
jgi:hypothetical protein